MRLIDADALLKILNKEKIPYDSDVNYYIMHAPPIEPKHGYWITWFENEDVRQAKCSECGMMFTLGKGRDIHYCGNCGAKMDEVEDV